MENVPEVIGAGNVKHFHKWLYKLESLGYTNFVEILNGKDFGIPQNRRRCFMVSILGDVAYDFPPKMKLKYHLKDFLEKKVDEKYYLDEKDIERISNWKAQQKPLDNRITIEGGANQLSPTLTARGAGEEHSGMILVEQLFQEGEVVGFDSSDDFRRKHNNHTSPSLVCHPKFGVVEKNKKTNGGGLPIVENTKQGYKVAHSGDGINLASRMKHQRGNVQKDSIQTLKAQMEIGVVIDEQEDN